MKFTKKTCIILASALLSAGIAVTSVITATEYSAEDPLISKSWVDNIFYPQIVQYVDAKIEEVKALFSPSTEVVAPAVDGTQTVNPPADGQDGTASVQPEAPTETPAQSSLSYEVVTLKNGQRIAAVDGSLELILRPGGTAAVYSEIEGNGVADLTNATELLGGTEVPVNAYCLVPRGDGRGIVCTSEVAYVMVRGKYEIK